MFFLLTFSPRRRSRGYVMQHCEVHGGQAWHELISSRSWVRLFFVPVLPLGGTQHLLTCTACGALWRLRGREADALAAQARTDVDVPRRGFGGFSLADAFRAATANSCRDSTSSWRPDSAYDDPYAEDPSRRPRVPGIRRNRPTDVSATLERRD